jgi:hypothetical protein
MMTESTTNSAPKVSIPATVRLKMCYRDGANWKQSEDYDYSNANSISEDDIMEALRSINSDEMVPAMYDLATSAPITHPDEEAHNNDDHCYIEFDADEHVSFPEKVTDPKFAEGDIADIIANIKEVAKKGSIESYRELTECVHREKIDNAKESLERANLELINKDELAELRELKAKYERYEGVELPLMAGIAYTHLHNPMSFGEIVRQGISRERLHTLQSKLTGIMGLKD